MFNQIKTIALLLLVTVSTYAQGPNNSGTYYKNANGKEGKNLKTALFNIISTHTQLTYSALWEAYKATDVREDGYIWDIYSNATKYVPGGKQQGVNYSVEGDSYNREHSMPKSWFHNEYPMYTDLFHLMPSDGYVNGRRSNFPFGENNGEIFSSKNNYSKLGKCLTKGGSGTVFEPNDEMKGDLARNYFYMATAYEDKIADWSSADGNGAEIFAGNSYPCYLDWQLDMLLRWAKNDPVSKKETERNNEVYKLQKNRNPYIDYPGLEQYVWGGMRTTSFEYEGYKGVSTWTDYSGNVITSDPYNPSNPDTPSDPTEDPDVTPSEGQNLYTKVTTAEDLKAGQKYILVYEKDKEGMALSDWNKGKTSYSKNVKVTINNNTISTATGSANAHEIVLGGNSNGWTLYDVSDKTYYQWVSGNSLEQTTTISDAAKWTITISNDNALITNVGDNTRSIYYNSSSPRFACYLASSKQKSVALYQYTATTEIQKAKIDEGGVWLNVYSIDGRLVRKHVRYEEAFKGLEKGIYIANNRKILIQ